MQTVRSGANFSESTRKSQARTGYIYFYIRIIGLHPAHKFMATAPKQALKRPVCGSTGDSGDVRAATLAQALAGDFVEHGWAVQENFLPAAHWRALADEAGQLGALGAFHKAGIG